VRILVVTAATGQGHVSAARALAEALRGAGVEARILDAGEHPFIRGGAASYNFFLRRPPGWMRGYYAAIHVLQVARTGGILMRRWVEQIYRREMPNIVVSVHPIFNFAIANAIARIGLPLRFVVVLTDLAPPFWTGWAEPRAELTIAPTADAARRLVALGVPPERIAVAGMPVPARFRVRASREERTAILRRLGLGAERFTLLVCAGTAGQRTTLAVLEALAAAPDLTARMQVVFVAGRSETLARSAAAVSAAFPVAVLAWQDDMDSLLGVADAVFTKPGGLTVSESLLKGVPPLVDVIAGVFPHEKGTADWVEAQRLGWQVRNPEDAVRVLRETSTAEWTARRERCREALPGDAASVAGRILAPA
jgi:UDP-N-acetylglucosamine:LPS N-acetylglucosamine transferase